MRNKHEFGRRSRVCISILCVMSGGIPTHAAETEAGVNTGSIAPLFTLPDVRGRVFDLQEHRGEIVVLNFWAFWCDTWKAELPHLKTLATKQKEMGFRLIALSVDGTRLREFMNLTGGNLPFPVLLDPGGSVSQRYHIAHVPTVIILDSAGKIRYRTFGYPGNDRVLHEITRIATDSISAQSNRSRARNKQPVNRENPLRDVGE